MGTTRHRRVPAVPPATGPYLLSSSNSRIYSLHTSGKLILSDSSGFEKKRHIQSQGSQFLVLEEYCYFIQDKQPPWRWKEQAANSLSTHFYAKTPRSADCFSVACEDFSLLLENNQRAPPSLPQRVGAALLTQWSWCRKGPGGGGRVAACSKGSHGKTSRMGKEGSGWGRVRGTSWKGSEGVSCSVMSNSLLPPQTVPLDSSVHGILQARILEWVVIPFSRGSSRSWDQTWVSFTAGKVFTIWATGEGPVNHKLTLS